MLINTVDKKLNVLHVATISQPIRSDLGYGPIETIIYNIDKGLHSLGHRSIVACPGDSRIAGEHFVTIGQSTGCYWSADPIKRDRAMNIHISKVLARVKRGDIDVIHAHDADAVKLIYDGTPGMRVPVVLTLHLRPKESLLEEAHQRWCNPELSPPVYCAPISEYQKKEYFGLLNVENVVYHGIDVSEYPEKEVPEKDSYLFTIGRVTRDKGQDKAIEIAKRTGSKLIIAGCVQNKAEDREFFESLSESIDMVVEVGKDPVDDDYYEKTIKPLLDSDKQIIYIGEINSAHKKQWFRHARATLFPIQWGEPFGLVPVESMACGTPVIALNKGAVPEIMVDGKTGFVVDSIDEMVEAVGRVDSIDPHLCRQYVQEKFSIRSMADGYSALYRQIIGGQATSPGSDLAHNLRPNLISGSVLAAS